MGVDLGLHNLLALIRRKVHFAATFAWKHRPDANQVLAGATLILVVLAYLALRDTEDTLELSERAWVGPSDAKIDAAPQKEKEVKATVSVRNTGRHPALDFTWNIRADVVRPNEADEMAKRIPEFVDSCFREQPAVRRVQVVYPTTGLGTGFEFNATVNKDKIDEAVVNGDSVIVLIGCLAYHTFNKVRHSAFCYFYQAKVTVDPNHLNLCAGGNDAD